MQETKLFAGENLTLKDEQIFEATPESLKDRKAPSLAVLYAEWTGPRRPLSHGVADEAFTRGNVPMTKMEVRTVSVAKLELTEKSVLYDVGARNRICLRGVRRSFRFREGLRYRKEPGGRGTSL